MIDHDAFVVQEMKDKMKVSVLFQDLEETLRCTK
jgi:hypothetical protein